MKCKTTIHQDKQEKECGEDSQHTEPSIYCTRERLRARAGGLGGLPSGFIGVEGKALEGFVVRGMADSWNESN